MRRGDANVIREAGGVKKKGEGEGTVMGVLIARRKKGEGKS